MRSRIFLLILSLSFITTLLSAQDNAKLERQINHLWEYSVKTFRSPRSGLFYGKALHELPPLKSYPTREQYRRGEYRTQGYKKGDEKTVGYNLHGGGSGTEDCTLFTGTLLGAMCDKYTATGDPSCRDQARMAYEGLRSAATAHGEPGFIARGVATPCMAKDGVGWGAHTAMMSILLAQAGFTSPLLDFDAALAEELGSRWRMADLYFKPYCCCRWAQASIAGALKIVRENHLAVSDIRRLVIHTFSKAASLSREHPTHTDAAQYNITYPIAVALLDGQISGAQVLPPRIFDKDVLELADMIEVVVEERFEERFPARTFSEVCITTTDGRELRSGELEPQWEPADSPSDEELLDKFTRLTAPVFGEQECARMREAIWHAEDLDNALDIWPRTLARHIEE